MPDPHNTDVKASLLRMVQIFESGDLADIRFVVSDQYVDHQGLEDVIAAGDRVAARLHWHGTNEQGTPMDRETIDIVRFADAVAVEHWGSRLWSSE